MDFHICTVDDFKSPLYSPALWQNAESFQFLILELYHEYSCQNQDLTKHYGE